MFGHSLSRVVIIGSYGHKKKSILPIDLRKRRFPRRDCFRVASATKMWRFLKPVPSRYSGANLRMHWPTLTRRQFAAVAGALATSVGNLTGRADERPAVSNPRATSGDTAVEPNWSERLTITVGPRDADITGTSQKAVQAAVDYVARLGGGTVKLLPGEYRLRNAVTLAAKVRLLGSGLDTILFKPASIRTKLAQDSDWYDQEITLDDPSGFQVGDGVCLRTKNPHNGSQTVAKRTLVARDGRRFKLDRPLRENFWLMGESTVSTLYPLVTGDYLTDLAIEDLAIDGNRTENDNLDGNYAGCIFLQDCSRVTIRKVTARRNNGDGISWQICHDVTVEDCHSHDHAGLGLHPGSGSQRPVMRNNRLERNDIGLFFCWGVKFGLAEGNQVDGNRVGISIGHRDTDNLIVENSVANSRDTGILFRPERGPAFAAHRNRVERNKVVNSGGMQGVAIDVQGATEQVTIKENSLREQREPGDRVGVRLGADTRELRVESNQIEGFRMAVDDRRGG